MKVYVTHPTLLAEGAYGSLCIPLGGGETDVVIEVEVKIVPILCLNVKDNCTGEAAPWATVSSPCYLWDLCDANVRWSDGLFCVSLDVEEGEVRETCMTSIGASKRPNVAF